MSEREGASVLPGPDPQASVSLLLACSTASGLPEGGGQGVGALFTHCPGRVQGLSSLLTQMLAEQEVFFFRWTVPL